MYKSLGDVYSPDVYGDWALQAKAAGGTVTTLPHFPGNVPGVAFPFWITPPASVVYNSSKWQDSNAEGDLYYAAPKVVLDFAAATGLVQQASIDAAVAKNPTPGADWLEKFRSAVKLGAIVAGVGVAAWFFLPIVRSRAIASTARTNPRRRRR